MLRLAVVGNFLAATGVGLAWSMRRAPRHGRRRDRQINGRNVVALLGQVIDRDGLP
jgi:hypothetical protein